MERRLFTEEPFSPRLRMRSLQPAIPELTLPAGPACYGIERVTSDNSLVGRHHSHNSLTGFCLLSIAQL